MGLLYKILGSFHKKKQNENTPNSEEIFANLSLDEQFVRNFKENGGIFTYCESPQEVMNAFDGILGENSETAKVGCLNAGLREQFSLGFSQFFTDDWQEVTFFLTQCEYLIASDGSILFSSNQLGLKKMNELPDKMIVFSTTSQIMTKVDDAMAAIRQREVFPTNITPLKNFGRKEDFTTYGSRKWKMYLILLEDLT